MADLTPEQLKAAQARGAKVKTIPKEVKVSEPVPVEFSGLQELMQTIQSMGEAQQRTQQIMIETLASVVAGLNDKPVPSSPDLRPLLVKLTDAVTALKQESVTESNMILDYEVDVDRDQRGLARKYRFAAVPKEVH